MKHLVSYTTVSYLIGALSLAVTTLGCGTNGGPAPNAPAGAAAQPGQGPAAKPAKPGEGAVAKPSDGTAAPPAEGLEVGSRAPEIEGEDIDGVAFKLSDYRGKVVVVDFWGNW